LKLVGLPLKKIRMMVRAKPAQLAEALRAQRGMLRTRRAAIDQAIGGLAELERMLESRQPIDGARLQPIIEAINPQSRSDLKTQYEYQLKGKVERLKDNLGRAKTVADLYRDFEASLEDDPSSARVQELAARWLELGVDPLGFDPQMIHAAGHMFREVFASAGDLRQVVPRFGNVKVSEFIQKALAARQVPNNSTGKES
jgi:hypothetical protein